MLAAPGVSCVCSDVPRAKSDRVRVEHALCRSIRVTANGADDVRTVFWRTTGSSKEPGSVLSGSAGSSLVQVAALDAETLAPLPRLCVANR